MTDLLGRDVDDQVLVLTRHPAIPALEQVLHGHGHLAVSAADQLLQLAGVYRVGLVGLGLELQSRGVPEHRQRPHFLAEARRNIPGRTGVLRAVLWAAV
jgi:hypothetical protein